MVWCGAYFCSIFSSHRETWSKARDVLNYIDFAVLFEAVLECAPQFIIQLYAVIVQEEPAAIIQIISLPISFLTLAWAFTATDKWSLVFNKIVPSSSSLNVKHQLALYATHLLLLSSRLFAICYFTVSFKWWVIGVLLVHSCVVVIATVIQNREEVDFDAYSVVLILLFTSIHSLRDDFVELSFQIHSVRGSGLTMSVYFSHICFVLENFFMILIFYFTYNPNAWYSLPVTVSVCVFSVLGSTMRICLFRWLSSSTAVMTTVMWILVLWSINMLVRYNLLMRLYFVCSYYLNLKCEVRFKLWKRVSKL